MRNFLILLVFILTCCQVGATDLELTLAFFNASPTTNRTVKLQATSPFPGNPVFLTSDTNGMAYYSNCPVGLINGEIQAPPGKIPFQVFIVNSALGLIDASNCLASGSSTTYPAGQVAWAIATSDQRYQLSGTTLSNTFYPLYDNPSNYVNTNALATYIFATTNGFTTIVYSNPASYTTPLQVSNIVNAIATTNGVSPAGVTNIANFIYTNNANGYATTNYVNDSTNALGSVLATQTINATNGLSGVLNTAIINSTNPIPAQTAAAIQIATNNPAITFLGPNVYSALTITGGEIANTPSSSGIAGAITIDSQTNGFGDIVTHNAADFVSQNQWNNGTNGFVDSSITNGFATQDFVNQLIAPLASIEYVNTATNGFITSTALVPYTPTSLMVALIAPLASTNYVNAAVAGLVGPSITNGFATIDYVNRATNSTYQAATNTAGQQASAAINSFAYTITNAYGYASLAKFNNTNLTIAATGFGTPSVNTIYFSAGNNIFVSGTGVYYFYDGSNWDFWSQVQGTLYQLGGLSPIGNAYTVANGANPAGSTFFTNAPVSQAMASYITNIAQNIQMSGFVMGAPTNNAISSGGSNTVYQIALAAAIAAGGPTNGVTAQVATNIASVMIVGANLVTNAAARSVTLNLGNSTNLPVLQSLSGTGFTVTYSQLPNGFSNANLTVSGGGGGGSALAYFNNNTPAGVVTTNSTSVGIGTNAFNSVLQGTSDPNGTVTALKGQYYSRFDLSGNFLYFQVNTNGATGWQ